MDQVIDSLFERYPSPFAMSEADQQELAELIRPLGFYNKRSQTLIDMALEYVDIKRLEKTAVAKRRGYVFDPIMLPGCGNYAFHSWMIFTRHVDTFEQWIKLFDYVPVKDKDLLNYLKWRSRYDPRNRGKRNPKDL